MLKLESELKEILSRFTDATGIKLPESAVDEAVRIYAGYYKSTYYYFIGWIDESEDVEPYIGIRGSDDLDPVDETIMRVIRDTARRAFFIRRRHYKSVLRSRGVCVDGIENSVLCDVLEKCR